MPEGFTLAAAPAAQSRPETLGQVDPNLIEGWDHAVAALPGANFFHSAAWARVLSESYGYRPAYFALRCGRELKAVVPLMEVRSWLTGRRGVGLPFTDESAPLAESPGAFEKVTQAAFAFGRQESWKYVELRGGRSRFPGAPASTSFLGHRLDLTGGEAGIFSRCESSVRRAVRKGEQSGLAIEFSRDIEAVRSFHDLLCLTRKRHGVPPQPFGFFVQIHRHVLAPGKGWVVLARHQGVPVAGAVYFHFGRTVTYKYGASDETFQHLRGNNAVMWESIKRHAADGFATLDFGRTDLDNEGLRKFKLSWGSVEHAVDYVRQDSRTGEFRGPPPPSASHARFFQALPAPVFRLVGALLYKHVA